MTSVRRKESLLYQWTDFTPDALFLARAVLRREVDRRGLPSGVSDDAVMAASELMANAVEHACGPYELHLRWMPLKVVCEVVDHDISGSEVLERRVASLGTSPSGVLQGLPERGRGLHIVNEVSGGTWGVRLLGSAKAVWFAVQLAAGDS